MQMSDCTHFITQQKLLQLSWEVMPTYHIAQNLYHQIYYLLCSLQNHVIVKTFGKSIKNDLIQFFASKNQTFIVHRITKLAGIFFKHNDQFITN